MHIVATAMTIELEMYTFLLYFCIVYPENFSHLFGRTYSNHIQDDIYNLPQSNGTNVQ